MGEPKGVSFRGGSKGWAQWVGPIVEYKGLSFRGGSKGWAQW